MKKLFLIMALAAAISCAANEYVDIYDEQASGTGRSIWYSISYDCPLKVFTITASDGPEPLEGVDAYLFYGDYSYQLMSSNITDAYGRAVLGMTGKDELLTHMFVVRLEKSGYKDTEIELFINCSKVPPGLPQNQSSATNQNQSSGTDNETDAGNDSTDLNQSQPLLPQNQSHAAQPQQQANDGGAGKPDCAPAFALLGLGAVLSARIIAPRR